MFLFEIPASAGTITKCLADMGEIDAYPGDTDGIQSFVSKDDVAVERLLTAFAVAYNKYDDGGNGDRWISNTRVRYNQHGVVESVITAEDALDEITHLFDLLSSSPEAALTALREAAKEYRRDIRLVCTDPLQSPRGHVASELIGSLPAVEATNGH